MRSKPHGGAPTQPAGSVRREAVHFVFPGRFQPLHYGHLDVIGRVLSQDKSLGATDDDIRALGMLRSIAFTVVLVDQPEPLLDNPLTIRERREMFKRARDDPAYSRWPAIRLDYMSAEAAERFALPFLESVILGPRPLVLLTGNPIAVECARRTSSRCIRVSNRTIVSGERSGTFVRHEIEKGKTAGINNCVPPSVLAYLHEINLQRRLIDLRRRG